MTSRLAKLIVHDARLQRRYHIYAAYAVVVGLYMAVFHFAGDALPVWVVAVVIASDPSVLGFFFLGGLMLLEKAEMARMALAMTPVSAGDYLIAKTVTLTAIALVAVTLLGIVSPHPLNWPLYLGSVALVSIEFVGIGAAFALRFRTVTGYLIGAGVLLLPAVLPGGFAFLDPMPVWAAALPFAAPLKLMLLSLGAGTASFFDIAVMLAASLAYAAGGFFWGVAALSRELGRK